MQSLRIRALWGGNQHLLRTTVVLLSRSYPTYKATSRENPPYSVCILQNQERQAFEEVSSTPSPS